MDEDLHSREQLHVGPLEALQWMELERRQRPFEIQLNIPPELQLHFPSDLQLRVPEDQSVDRVPGLLMRGLNRFLALGMLPPTEFEMITPSDLVR